MSLLSANADETLDSALSTSYLWGNDFPALPRIMKGSML